jgi:hypothetical protein
MFVDDYPVTVDLAIHIGEPHGQIDRLSFRVSTSDMLNRVTVGEWVSRRDLQVSDLELRRAVEKGEEVFPILRYAVAPTYWRGGTTSNTSSVSSGTYAFMIASTSLALTAAANWFSRARILASSSVG